jgi:hypothetical protein
MVKKAVNGAQGNDGENTIYKVSPVPFLDVRLDADQV